MKELETCLASLGIGLSLGLIGAGGSILTIPVFVYILKKDPGFFQRVLDVRSRYIKYGGQYSVNFQ
jgi:uncharacterized membrane protein YfcA